MKKIYPNFYNLEPMPTEEGYILLKCLNCQEIWLYNATDLKKTDRKCPYCGMLHTLDEYYQAAYEDTYHYYHMIAVKNLLELINIKIEITENATEEKQKRFQVIFINIPQPNEKEMNDYVQFAYQELKKRADEKTLEIEMKVPVYMQQMLNEDDFIELRTDCCESLLKVKKGHELIKHCVYCNSDL